MTLIFITSSIHGVFKFASPQIRPLRGRYWDNPRKGIDYLTIVPFTWNSYCDNAFFLIIATKQNYLKIFVRHYTHGNIITVADSLVFVDCP